MNPQMDGLNSQNWKHESKGVLHVKFITLKTTLFFMRLKTEISIYQKYYRQTKRCNASLQWEVVVQRVAGGGTGKYPDEVFKNQVRTHDTAFIEIVSTLGSHLEGVVVYWKR